MAITRVRGPLLLLAVDSAEEELVLLLLLWETTTSLLSPFKNVVKVDADAEDGDDELTRGL